ncbi:TOBE domain-containing protein [Martelella mediterranea]|uniref:TOBE domain-containing protein n=1 Tax=Martelella mediterranea TaxID=293089 RepID=A0A4R3NI27_9HYPH|nr:TOBE domain-containing protein [Martelella mediterranea]TCT31702.1 TOBE domain-containing protein [Martelella mediterranea]
MNQKSSLIQILKSVPPALTSDIEQVGAPMDLYNTPRTTFVAGFIGSPKMNLFRGPDLGMADTGYYGIRPEHLAIVAPGQGRWNGKVRHIERLGAEIIAHIQVEGAGLFVARTEGELDALPGTEVGLSPRPNKEHFFPAA